MADSTPIFYLGSVVKGLAKKYQRIVRCERAKSDEQGRFGFAAAPRAPQTFIVWWREGMAPGKQVHLEQLRNADAGRLELRADPPASVALHIDRQAFPDAAEVALLRR